MQANKGWISELPNEAGMSRLGEATVLSDPNLARTLAE